MLSIGEFSNICKVSTKTLRYYAEIGLLEPSEVNPENGYRYYSIGQLEKMLFISRLKSYSFSLDEIKEIVEADADKSDKLYTAFLRKKQEMSEQYGVKFPFGASAAVTKFAKQFAKKFGKDELKKVAKLNFANYKEIE
jgi:DNA-binding transcriptional MerR regulator